MESPVIPNGDRLVLRLIEAEETRHGNIIVPDSGEDSALIGEVLASGEGRITPEGDLIKNKTKIGDKVLLPKFGSHKFVWDNEDYIIVHENDILGKLNEDTNE